MQSSQYQKLTALHARKAIELWPSKNLGHPKYNQFLMALGGRKPETLTKSLLDMIRWGFEIIVLGYLLFFAPMDWWLGLIWLAAVIWYETRKSRYDIEKLVIESALSDETVFEALWNDGLIGIHSPRNNETYSNRDPNLKIDWRSVIDTL